MDRSYGELFIFTVFFSAVEQCLCTVLEIFVYIFLQVLLSQSHRFRALVLLGRFLDMGAWAVDLVIIIVFIKLSFLWK